MRERERERQRATASKRQRNMQLCVMDEHKYKHKHGWRKEKRITKRMPSTDVWINLLSWYEIIRWDYTIQQRLLINPIDRLLALTCLTALLIKITKNDV